MDRAGLKIDFSNDVYKRDSFCNQQISGFYGHRGLTANIIAQVFRQGIQFGKIRRHPSRIDFVGNIRRAAAPIPVAKLFAKRLFELKLVEVPHAVKQHLVFSQSGTQHTVKRGDPGSGCNPPGGGGGSEKGSVGGGGLDGIAHVQFGQFRG